jgi:hypothetical protein
MKLCSVGAQVGLAAMALCLPGLSPSAVSMPQTSAKTSALRFKFRRGSAVAKVAIARKLAVRLYWKQREAGHPSAARSYAG